MHHSLDRPPPISFERPAEPVSALPRPLTSFVGREEEIASIGSSLTGGDVRLLTLTGPGGVGKSRLAIRVAAELAANFTDGVGFVALAPVADPSLVASTIAVAVGVLETDGASVEQRLASVLAERTMLLVLDNFEQVVAAAPVVSNLLAAAPGISVLATSRVALRIAGEHEYTVPPLLLPDAVSASIDVLERSPAVALFAQRAKTVRSSFAIDETNAEAIVDVCRKLDGLPLAIELAAARSKVLSPAALLARMSPGLDLLTGGPRDHPVRLQTMRAAIAWSYDLLTPDEQALFRWLSVFAGGFTLDAAEAVTRDRDEKPHDLLEGVTALVDRSLLLQAEDASGEPRFSMLSTIRAFAAERLTDQQESDAALTALTRWCSTLTGDSGRYVIDVPEAATLDRIEAELGNVRAAFDWLETASDRALELRLAGQLGSFWYFRGHLSEGRDRLTRALQRADAEVGFADRDRGRYWLETLSIMGEHGPDTLIWLQANYERFCAGGDWKSAIASLILLGAAAEFRGEDATAMDCFRDALTLSRETGDVRLTLWSLVNLADCAYRLGDRALSAACAREAIALSEIVQERLLRTYALIVALQAELDEGNADQAFSLSSTCLAISRQAGDQLGIGASLVGLASVQLARGHAARAVRVLGGADAIRESMGVGAALNHGLQRRTIEMARGALSPVAFADANLAGRALPRMDVIAEALATGDPAMSTAPARKPSNTGGLTAREREVLDLLMDGRTDRQIADALFISHRTTQVHVGSIFAKLGVNTRAAAVTAAHRLGMTGQVADT